MAAFDYTALDEQGRRHKGVMEAESARQLRQKLRAKSLTPVNVQEVVQAKSNQFRAQKRLGAREVSMFTRQLATLSQAGLPVEEALQTLARQSGNARLKGVISSIRTQVMEGKSLTESFAAFPQSFNSMYRTSVAAGERTGHLSTVLTHLADFAEESYRARQKVLLALLYPGILTAVSFAIVIFLLTYVVPDMIRVFTGAGRTLPWLTRALITVSEGLQHGGVLLMLLIGASIFGARLWLRRPGVRLKLDERMLGWPLIGPVMAQHSTARFSATLGMLQDSGVPLVQALDIAGAVLANRHMQAKVRTMTQQVTEGMALSQALERSEAFPPLLSTMTASGEASGQLGVMLSRTAAITQKDLENRIAVMLGLFEPAVLLLMGGVVLLLVLAIVLPILNLNQLVQ